MMTKDLLLEIGSDEIPARYLLPAISEIKDRARSALEGARLNFNKIESYGTPRRLVVYVTDLASNSRDATTKVRGPSKKVAFDSDGNPARALKGFCRSLGIEPSDTVIEQEPGGEYVYGFKHDAGRPVQDILPEILPGVVMGMDCPHPLRWGEQNWRWYRPIRWVTCLFGEQVVSLEVAGVKSGAVSFGHRALHPGEVEITNASRYFEVIEDAGVIVDQNRRKEIIIDGARKLSKEISGKPFEDEGLVNEVTCLCEHPAPFRGEFSQAYLDLPNEVLITVMRYHQRYFPIVDANNNVLPGFIGVRDGSPKRGKDNVIKGNQWVLVARLEDASFFYSQDIKTPLAGRLPELKGVYFLRGAGNLYDKTLRLIEITTYLGRSLGLSESRMEPAREAARLAKCDLVTSMVRELPELEGIMGGHYARLQGAEEQVANAVSQHYLPKGAGDNLPDKGISALVALADKLDTLSVAFCLGVEVSGSQDPMGLRRAALGVVNIILSHGYDLDLNELLKFAVKLGMQAVDTKTGTLKHAQNKTNKRRKKSANARAKSEQAVFLELREFLLHRVEGILSDKGYPIEMIRGITAGGEARISRFPLMARALWPIRDTEILKDTVAGWRRTSVLGSKAPGRDVSPDLLVEEPEKELYDLITSKKAYMEALFEEKKYEQYLEELGALRAPIDDCLDNVLIMAKEDEIRQNRLNLLGLVSDMFTRFADFSYVLPLVGKP